MTFFFQVLYLNYLNVFSRLASFSSESTGYDCNEHREESHTEILSRLKRYQVSIKGIFKTFHIHQRMIHFLIPRTIQTMDSETWCGLPSTDQKARLIIGAACCFWNFFGQSSAAAVWPLAWLQHPTPIIRVLGWYLVTGTS